MDEYLFITLAKLKADRLQLQRQQLQLELPVPAPQHLPKQTAKPSPLVSWFSRAPLWREQS